jgi:hypothetical protein
MSSSNHDDKVRALAYQLWEEAGKPADRDDEFWHQARAQIPHPPSVPDAEPHHDAPSNADSPLPAGVPAKH